MLENNEEQIIKRTDTGLCNYYGEVQLVENNNKSYLALESWDGEWAIEVSKEFAEAFKSEFKERKKIISLQ